MSPKSSFGWILTCIAATAIHAAAQEPATQPPSSQTVTAQPPASASDNKTPAKTTSLNARHKAEKIYLEGAKALENKNLRKAAEEFAKAHELDPDNLRYTATVEIGRQHLVTELVQEAEKAKLLGHIDESHAKLAEALKLDPQNPIAAQHMHELAGELVPQHAQLQTEVDTGAPPIQLTPAIARHTFHLHTSEQDLLRQVLSAYGIQPTMDSSVKNQSVRFDVDDVDFTQAANMVKLVTNTFIVPLDPVRVLVALDTKDNRTKYERQVMETVYLPGSNITEMTDMGNMARNVFGATQITLAMEKSSMTVRAPEGQLNALNAAMQEMLNGKSQIRLDVRMYSVDKTRNMDLGVILPNTTTLFNIPSELNSVIAQNQSLVDQIISSGLASAGDYEAIAAILIAAGAVSGVLSQPFGYFGGGLTLTGLTIGGGTANMQLNASNTHSIDQMQLIALDQEDQTIRSGTRYPIITSTYSSLSGSSVSIPGLSSSGLSSTLASLGISASSLTSSTSQTIPQVQYQDIGLTLKVTPRIEKDKAVSLKLELKLVSLQGATINDIPVLSNREYSATTTLRTGETATLVSAMSKQESSAVTGLPGLDELPGFQSGTNDNSTKDTSQLVIAITPHIVRLAHSEMAGHMLLLPPHP